MPQISVIVPVYNVENYIHRCVDSILNQTFRDFELILVDDGSPDNCGAICDQYALKDSCIQVIHQENGGLSAARNSGIAAAVGTYLFFIDSDDVLHPDCLHILMDCIGDSGAEIAMGRLARFSGMTVPENLVLPWDGNSVCRTNLETLDCFFEDGENLPALVSACCKLWHRSLFDGIEFPVGRLFEDEFTTYRLYHKAKKTVFVNTALYFYYVNDGGITRNLTLEKRFDEYDAQWERLEYFRERNMTALLGKAAMTFLKTAQWDLIACREAREKVSPTKKQRFEMQYRESLQQAQKLCLLDFLNHYDYYVLAYPQYTFFWRVKRQLLLHLRKKV